MSADVFSDVTVTRSGREERVLRLEEDEHADAVSVPPAPDFFRYVNETPEFHLYANIISVSYGKDPEKLLRSWLEKRAKLGKRAEARLQTLLGAERERRRAGGKAWVPANETHRKKLLRALKPLMPSAITRKGFVDFLCDPRAEDRYFSVGEHVAGSLTPTLTLGPFTLGPGRKKSVPRKPLAE